MISLQQHLEATTPKRILALDGGIADTMARFSEKIENTLWPQRFSHEIVNGYITFSGLSNGDASSAHLVRNEICRL